MNILGISAFYHDSACCLVRDGEIIAAAQEERFTRRKHDQDFPRRAVDYCLRAGGITMGDVGTVVFYEKPFLKFERIVETSLAFAPRGLRPFLMAIPLWLKEKLWMSEVIRKELIGFNGELLFTQHHEAHAASAFYPSPFDEAAFLTVDGVGEWATTSWGTGTGNTIEIANELQFPHSLGLLYSAFTYYTGFKVNSAEYKVMGLAPYGKPVYAGRIYEHLLDLKTDGSFKLNQEYFNYCAGLTMTNGKFHALFGGEPREPEGPLTQREMDLAASVQEVTEEVMMRIARHVRKQTGQRRLCLAGGVSLNCVANGKILRAGIFDDFWIQPAAGDAGGALGAALFAWHAVQGNKRTVVYGMDKMKGSLLGPSYGDKEIRDFLLQNSIPSEPYEEDALLSKVADLLSAGKVIGWFQGRMEYGPRALGNRSIIGDARRPDMQSRMNLKVKFRESFRPFAPAVLAEKSADYFELDRDSPYMLLTTDVRKDKRKNLTAEEERLEGIERLNAVRSVIPAVTHVDHSARVQTVRKDTNPMFHALIERFYDTTGCPVIINTSFNVRGEPIVCSPEDAYLCFMTTDMDCLVLGMNVLDKSKQSPRPKAEGRVLQTAPAREAHMIQDIQKELYRLDSSDKSLKKFGLLLAGILLLMMGILYWRENTHGSLIALLGAVIFLAGSMYPRALLHPYRLWMAMAFVLGWIMTRILLSLAYWLIMTPMGLLLRIVRKDVLNERIDRTSTSYWTTHEPVVDRRQYTKQY